MTQVSRMGKPTVCCMIRNYSNQSYQQNHYEILKIPRNASQEDIKQSFFKLSKQLHPDTSGRYSHTDFVKLNEAYSVLGKANTRRKYDEDLKYKSNIYGTYTNQHTYGCSQNMQYGSQWEYEVRTAGGPWPPPKHNSNASIGLIIALLFLGMGLFQFTFMIHSMKVRKLNNLRDMRIKQQYKHLQNITYNQTNNIHQLDKTNLNEFLTKND